MGETLGISAKTANKLAKVGRIGYVRLTDSKWVFTMELVEEFIKAETNHRDFPYYG